MRPRSATNADVNPPPCTQPARDTEGRVRAAAGQRWSVAMLAVLGRAKHALLRCVRALYKGLVVVRAGSYREPLKVNGFSRVTPQTHLGTNVNFNGFRIEGHGTVRIGNNFHSGAGCLVITEIHNYDHGTAIPYDATAITKDVLIGDNVWLGARVLILGGVRLGEGAIIQAGAVVVADIPACAIAGGNPARVFKYRDLEHYRELKARRMFF